MWGLGVRNSFVPLFIRTPSFTTRGIDEDEAEDDTDFGADVDIGADDAADESGFTLVGATGKLETRAAAHIGLSSIVYKDGQSQVQLYVLYCMCNKI